MKWLPGLQSFLNWNTTDTSNSVKMSLEGNLQEVIGQMELVRWSMTVRVASKCKITAPDLAKMGLEVIAFTVQSFSDEGESSITSVENVETIKKDALIAKAEAERERKGSRSENINWRQTRRCRSWNRAKTKQLKLRNKQPSSKKRMCPSKSGCR